MSKSKQCSVCGQPATIFITLVKNGQVVSMACCPTHAEEMGLNQTGACGWLDDSLGENGLETTPTSRLRCPECGFTARDWKRTGRLGCPHCYEVFAEKLVPALQRLHSGTIHRGKFPHQAISPQLIVNRIQELQEQLEREVQEERYEDAAATRDQMSELRSSLSEK